VFLTIVLLIWSSLHLFVFWRISSIPAIARNTPGKYLVIAAVFLWGSFLLSRFLDTPKLAGIARLFEVMALAGWGFCS
jgi:hypothetical protein